MRVAISNIAWDTAEDEPVAALLHACGVDAIDVAPSKYFPDFARATDAEIARVRSTWGARAIEITGMQALLFGTTGLNVFADESVQSRLLDHLEHVCRIGAGLGGTRLVFGSPKNRDRGGLSDREAHEIAVRFFTRAGDVAQKHGVTICLEPNPPQYGCNFMTTAAEAARVVAAIAHPHIRMQLDLGAVRMNGERIEDILEKHAALVGHVHVSEPDLVPVGTAGTDHESLGSRVHAALPHHVACIEMLPAKSEPRLDAIERALRVTKRCYGRPEVERSAA